MVRTEEYLAREVGRLEREIIELRAELRSQRGTIDALLIARQHSASGPGLTNLLREEVDVPDMSSEERERLAEEEAQFRKAWSSLYGEGVTDG
jgi:hypothetical protein